MYAGAKSFKATARRVLNWMARQTVPMLGSASGLSPTISYPSICGSGSPAAGSRLGSPSLIGGNRDSVGSSGMMLLRRMTAHYFSHKEA
jgi:hypothetical protein